MTTLLLTRPQEASERFAALFAARHPEVPVVISPVMAIRPLPHVLPGDGDFIVTSRHALAGVDPAGLRGRRVWAVGEATQAALAAAGALPQGWAPDAAGLLGRIAADTAGQGSAGPFWHLAGRHRVGLGAQGDLAARLSALGLRAGVVEVYEQPSLPLSPEARGLLARPGAVLLPLFSPRSARLLAAASGPAEAVRARLLAAPISPAAAEAWSGPAPEAWRIAASPDAAGMLAALSALLVAGGRLEAGPGGR